MATYYNKTLIDGVEELPRLTQAEFDLLPLAQKPKIWVKRNATETDRGITAEDVQYGDGNVDSGLNSRLSFDTSTITSMDAIAFYTDHHRVQINTVLKDDGYKNRFDIYDDKLRVRIYDATNTLVSDKSVTLS